MAVQMQVIFSDKVIGSGIIAGMPFNCMQGDFGNFKKCHDASQINLQTLESLTDQLASQGKIAQTQNLAGKPIWMFTGTHDQLVPQPVMEQA
jgi:hypothetical protein